MATGWGDNTWGDIGWGGETIYEVSIQESLTTAVAWGGDTWGGWDDLGFELGYLVHEELELGFEVGDGFGGFLVHGVG